MKANPTETRLGMTTAATVFARTSQAQHDLQLNKAMNMRCRSPEQHKRKATTNSHTGNSTSTSLCTTSSPSSSSVCRREGKGKGLCVSLCCGLSFPTPPLWFPVLSSPTFASWELAGRHAGLAAGDAKRMSEMQNDIVACMRSANMPNGRPTCRGGSPRCKKKHVLPRTTTYDHVLPRTARYYHVLQRTITYYYKHSFCISGSHPCMSALSILLFY